MLVRVCLGTAIIMRHSSNFSRVIQVKLLMDQETPATEVVDGGLTPILMATKTNMTHTSYVLCWDPVKNAHNFNINGTSNLPHFFFLPFLLQCLVLFSCSTTFRISQLSKPQSQLQHQGASGTIPLHQTSYFPKREIVFLP